MSNSSTKGYNSSILIEAPGVAIYVYSPSQRLKSYFAPYPLPPFLPIPEKNEEAPLQPTQFEIYFSIPIGEVTFNPMQVLMRLRDGTILRPAGFRFKGKLRTEEVFIEVTDGSRVVIVFEPQSETSITLSLPRITVKGNEITMPDLHYEMTSAWHIYAAP